MRPARIQYAFSCRHCGKAALLETVLLPLISQSVVDVGYVSEPCQFGGSARCLYWFEAKTRASRLLPDVAEPLSMQEDSRDADREYRSRTRQAGEKSRTIIKLVK